MHETGPSTLTKGIELQKATIEDIQRRARDKYRELVTLERDIERRIEIALSKPPNDESVEELSQLFDQKHALDEIGRDLEEMILRSSDKQDDLRERWLRIEERLRAANGHAAQPTAD